MVMPHEVALELRQFDVGVIDFADDLRLVLFVEERELLRKIDLIQAGLQ